MLSRVCFLCFFLVCCGVLSAQITLTETDRDTIAYKSSFLNRSYHLNGKPLTLPVMAFFMKDFPGPNNDIQVAQLGDQLCITGYGLGSLFTVGGLMVARQNKDLGQDLIQLGLAGIGAGLVFQIISGSFKFRAVRHYNEEVQRAQRKSSSRVQIRADFYQAGLYVGF